MSCIGVPLDSLTLEVTTDSNIHPSRDGAVNSYGTLRVEGEELEIEDDDDHFEKKFWQRPSRLRTHAGL